MNITIRPAPLAGTLRVPSSKSMTHRETIADALAKGETEVTGVINLVRRYRSVARILSLFGAAIEKRREGRITLSHLGGLRSRKAYFMPMPANRAPPSAHSLAREIMWCTPAATAVGAAPDALL